MILFCETCSNWHEEGQHNPHIVAPEPSTAHITELTTNPDALVFNLRSADGPIPLVYGPDTVRLISPDPDNEGTD